MPRMPWISLAHLADLLGFAFQELQRFSLLLALALFRAARRLALRDARLMIAPLAFLAWIASLFFPGGFLVCFAFALALSVLLIPITLWLEPSMGRAQFALHTLLASRPARLETLALRLSSRSVARRRSSRSRL